MNRLDSYILTRTKYASSSMCNVSGAWRWGFRSDAETTAMVFADPAGEELEGAFAIVPPPSWSWREAHGVLHRDGTSNTKGYSSTYLAMGFANVRAGTRVLMLVLVQARGTPLQAPIPRRVVGVR